MSTTDAIEFDEALAGRAARKPAGDTRPPPTMLETAGASLRNAMDHAPRVEAHRLNSAYADVVDQLTAVNGKRPRDYAAPWWHSLNPLGSATIYDGDAIMRDVAAAQARGQFKGTPATRDQFESEILTRQGAQAHDADTVARGGWLAGVVGGAPVGVVDPINVGMMLATGGMATISRGVLGAMAREAGVNVATEALQTPQNIAAALALGETMGAREIGQNLASAALLGAAFPVAGKVGGKIAGALDAGGARVLAPVRARVDIAFRERDYANALSAAVPEHLRTPDEAAALHVLTRAAEIDASSPYSKTYAAMDAHTARLESAMLDLHEGARARPVAAASRARMTGPLDLDQALGFVVDRQEGGSKITRDSGGLTKFGISQNAHPGVDIANLSRAQAMDIYRREYAAPLDLARHPADVGIVALDAAVNHGPAFAQRLLREAGDDPAKMIALRRGEYARLIAENPGKYGGYVRGWENRMRQLEAKIGLRPGEAGSAGALADDGEAASIDNDLAGALDAERADIERRSAEAAAGASEPSPELPQLREDLFPNDPVGHRIAQAASDAEHLGTEPAVTRASVWTEARDALMAAKAGEAPGVLYHADIGPIDVKWGDAKGGLAKIVEKHAEVLDELPALIEQMGVKSRSENRVILQSLDHRAVVSLDWHGADQRWLLSAYKFEGKVPSATVDRGAADGARDRSPSAGTAGDIGADGASGKMPADLAAVSRPIGINAAGEHVSGFHRFETARGPVSWDPATGHANGAVPNRTGVTADDIRALLGGSQLRAAVESADGTALAQAALYADPAGAALAAHGEQILHDLKVAADSDARAYRLNDGGDRTIADVLGDFDSEKAAIEAVRGCL